MTQKQVKQIVFAAQNFGADHASQIAKLFKAANNLDKLTKEVVANGKALEAQCKEDMEKYKTH